MAYKKLVRVRSLTFSANGDSAGQVDFSIIPSSEGGKTLYVDSVQIRVSGTLTSSGGGTATISAGAITKLINRVYWNIPNVGMLLSSEGINLARFKRLADLGQRSTGTSSFASAGTGGTNAIDFTLEHRLADPLSIRTRDGAIPAAMLRDSEFKVTFGAATDVDSTALASFAGTVEVSAVCSARSSLEIPLMATVETFNYGAATTEPTISRGPYKVTHLAAARQNGSAWATTDFPVLGLRFGSQVASEDSLSVAPYYALFNSSAETAMTIHTASTPSADDTLPIVFPEYSRSGDRITDAPEGSAACRLYTSTAAAGWVLIRRVVWADGPWRAQAERLCGISPSAKLEAVTADATDVSKASVNAYVPKRQVG